MKAIMNTPGVVERVKNARKGIKFSEKHIENLSKSHMGKSPGNKGVPMSEQQKAVLREKKAWKMKKVYCAETQTVYESTAAAARETGLRAGNIWSVCKGTRTQTGGCHFRFWEG